MSQKPTRDLVRIPGLFRRWEFPEILRPHTDFRIEEAGAASDGTPLFAIYRREDPERNVHVDHRF